MLRALLGKGKTTKPDVVMAVVAAAMAVWEAVNTINNYKADKAKEIEENPA